MCHRANQPRKALTLWGEFSKLSSLPVDSVSMLVYACAKAEDAIIARNILDKLNAAEIKLRLTARDCTNLIKVFAAGKDIRSIHDVWEYAGSKQIIFDVIALTCVLKACADMEALMLGETVHDFIVNNSIKKDIYLENALINMYVKCGEPQKAAIWNNMNLRPDTITYISIATAAANIGNEDIMRKVYESVAKSTVNQDITLQTAMINMQAKCGQPIQAFSTWKLLSNIHTSLPSPTYVSVLTACANIGDIRLGQQVSDHIQSSGVHQDLKVHHALMQMYTKCGAPDRSYGIWKKLCEGGIKQNYITFACALSACASATALSWGQKVHNYIKSQEATSELVVQTALLDMYAKSGKLNYAVEIFTRMPEKKDVQAWTAMINAYGIHGQGNSALSTFDRMPITPNATTFLSVISACSHAGLVDAALAMYRKLISLDIIPTIKHQTAVVDTLARAGLLDEAEEFIRNEIAQPDTNLWRSVLGACRANVDVKRAEKVANYALELDPTDSSVLLRYGAAGLHERQSGIRIRLDKLITKGGHKKLGKSTVIDPVDGTLQTFVAKDMRHKELFPQLTWMNQALILDGHNPDTSWVVKAGIEEEAEKVDELCFHSEKIALAHLLLRAPHLKEYILIHTSFNIWPFDYIIDIFSNNLRMCGECHAAMKRLSRILVKIIVIRDTNRFHRFYNGECSCGDYF